MAFSFAGDLNGSLPIVRNFQIGADVYQGQIVIGSAAAGGAVIPTAASAAGPDTASQILGIVTGIVTDPTYNATYKGDKGTYDTAQADLVANDPVGAAEAQVTLITPSTLIRGPIVKDTIGTAAERKDCTTGSADGLSFIIAAIDTTVDDYSSAYCYSGANKGIYRTVTTGATETQTFTIAFPYDIAIGDSFCVVNVALGAAHIDFDSQFQGIDASDALSNYFEIYVHELNLETAGQEYAVFTIDSKHLVCG